MGQTMSKNIEPTSSDQRIVVVIDDNKTQRELLRKSILRLSDKHCRIEEAPSAATGLALVQSLERENIDVLAVDLSLGADEVEGSIGLIQELRRARPTARILAYTLMPLPDLASRVLEAGASSYVAADSLQQVIAAVFLQNELHQIEKTYPLVKRLLDAIGIGISVQDADMNLLWMNSFNQAQTDAGDARGSKCWVCYHGFTHRTRPCSPCAAWEAISEAKRRLRVGDSIGEQGFKIESKLIVPVRGSIAQVEVIAVPLLSADKREVMAVVEASRFTTDEWLRTVAAHIRYQDVLNSVLTLGSEGDGAAPFLTVSVYYRTGASGDFFLNCWACSQDVDKPPAVLRDLPAELQVAADNQGFAFSRSTHPDEYPSRFISVQQTSQETTVLIEVVFYDILARKSDGLFTHDLLPYWAHLHQNFEEARTSRDAEFAQRANLAIQAFLAHTSPGLAQGPVEREVEELAIKCLVEVLNPTSAHIRRLHRDNNYLVKEAGIGVYYELAHEKQQLARDGEGSVLAASSGKEVLRLNVTLPDLERGLERSPSDAQLRVLRGISSLVVLPLVFTSRVLGTIAAQFDDDSLLSEAKRTFLQSLAASLSGVLGRLAWAAERRKFSEHIRGIDETIFVADASGHREQDTRILEQATRMVFELTYAELVCFYEVQDQTDQLVLVEGVTQGRPPDGGMLPRKQSNRLGVPGRAFQARKPHFVHNFNDEQWRSVHEEVLAIFRDGTERKLFEWVACQLAVPIFAGEAVIGVLVASASIPGWLSPEDQQIIEETAFKMGLALTTQRLIKQLQVELSTIQSLKALYWAVDRGVSEQARDRMLLLFVTAGEGLGFSRAVLFKRTTDGVEMRAARAVGATTREYSEDRWREADAVSFDEKMLRCLKEELSEREGDLQVSIRDQALALESELMTTLEHGDVLIRRTGSPHLTQNPELVQLLTPDGMDIDYILFPMRVNESLNSVILADRAFLPISHIDDRTYSRLELLSAELRVPHHQIMWWMREQADEVAWGMNYALRTRSAALSAWLDILELELPSGYEHVVERMRRAIDFFRRGSTVASKILRPADPTLRRRQDLSAVVEKTIQFVNDARVRSQVPSELFFVSAEPGRIEDVLLELLTNARDVIDLVHGFVLVYIIGRNDNVEVHVEDNGPGINPAFRQSLFKRFKSFPITSGLGLGLAYARALAEAHGGTLEEIGSIDSGAHFILTLPLVKEEL
jgi:signal transduction histidine kinase/CheY-like chemotaxis protein